MDKIKSILFACGFITALCLTSLTISTLRRGFASADAGQTGKSVIVQITAEQAVGGRPFFKGDPHSRYSLVEFADYECGPCKRIQALVNTTLNRYNGKLKVTFRNFPLTEIHSHAWSAATLAEQARIGGKFWEVHDALFSRQDNLSDNTFKDIAKSSGILTHVNQLAAVKDVERVIHADIEAAHRAGIEGTLTFLLCCPDNRVVRLASIDDIPRFIR